MVNNCCVVGCKNYVGKKPDLHFYRFPMSDKERCAKWEAAVHRKDWHPKSYTRICGEHFVSGKPNASRIHPDYVPSVFPSVYHTTAHLPTQNHEETNNRLMRRLVRSSKNDKAEMEKRIEEEQQQQEQQELITEGRKRQREERREERRQKSAFDKEQKKRKTMEKQQAREEDLQSILMETEKVVEEDKAREERERLAKIRQKEAREEEKKRRMEDDRRKMEEKKEDLKKRREEVNSQLKDLEQNYHKLQKVKQQLDMEEQAHEVEKSRSDDLNRAGTSCDDICYPLFTAHATQQTDSICTNYDQVIDENKFLKGESRHLHFCMSMISGDDKRSNFYTGLPWKIVVHLFEFLSVDAGVSSRSQSPLSLELEDEFFMVLVRLRLGLLVDDLAERFGITNARVTRIFQKWLHVMYQRLQFLIKWPDQEVMRQNMPLAFKQLYPKCICIIDCSEIFIEIPNNFSARSKTYSNYKKHNTVKFLIGITPCGSISFVSECWGGRVSDKVITLESKFLDYIRPGDVILADRGFTVADDIGLHGGRLEIPSFTKGKSQLSQYDVEHSKQLSKVRIHVERVIGHLKKKFTILKGPLTVPLLKHKNDIDTANIDRILVTCAALCNLMKSVI